MGDKSAIQWTNSSWTPIRARVKVDALQIAETRGYTSLLPILKSIPPGKVGPHCEHVSPGCEHCYSETNNGRCLPSNGTGLPFDRRSRDLVGIFLDEKILEQPLRWKLGRKIFVCSQTDLFAEFVPDEFIDQVFAVMALCPQHTFQILTKRPDRMREYCADEETLGRVARESDRISVAAEINKMRPEETRPIPDYPGYFATDRGRILSSSGSAKCLFCGNTVDGIATKAYCGKKCRQNANYYRRIGRLIEGERVLTEMSPDVGEQGHMRVMLYRDGLHSRELVHRLILTVFARAALPGEQCCHRDGNPANNALPNLRWGTQSDNWDDRIRHGNSRSSSKLTLRQVNEIKGLRRSLVSKAEVARRFDISETQVSFIDTGEQWAERSGWPLRNCWAGVSVEDRATADERIPLLLQTPAAVRFVSYEPGISGIDIEHFLYKTCRKWEGGVCDGPDCPGRGIDWVIIGGESGPKARPFDIQWARDVIAQCKAAGTACFVKQVGRHPIDNDYQTEREHFKWLTRGPSFHPHLKDSHGGDWDEWPADLRVRQFPEVRS